MKGTNTMNKKYIEEFREDLKEFKEVTEKFYNKEVSIPEYKSFSGVFEVMHSVVEREVCSGCV